MNQNSPKNKMEKHKTQPSLSVITPAYNEARNLPEFYKRLKKVADDIGETWEWVIVDDHSTDNSYVEICNLNRIDTRVKGVRLSKNFGSHAAISCGLEHANGKCAIVMASDLQDPPEAIPIVLEEWKKGFHVVWGARGKREGEKKSTIILSRLFFFLMRKFVGIKEMHATGADFFLIDRRVINEFIKFKERNLSIVALIIWMGFRQTTVTYDKKPRLHGSSGWTLSKKIKIVIDSITSFSFIPIRIMSILGILISFLGFTYATLVVWNTITGKPPEGWASLMVVVLIIGGFSMLMMGILGEYLWRALDESRHRPRYLIENKTE